MVCFCGETNEATRTVCVRCGASLVAGVVGIGDVVGGVRVERRLGGGAMGSVYAGRHLRLDREVALKVILPGLLSGPGSARVRTRFQREARLASKVEHRGVVRVHDVGVEGGVDFMVLELVEGESLEEILESRGALAVDEAARIGVAIASALGAAHALGVVHRDVKPENILIESATDRVVVGDFGLAKALDPMEQSRSLTKGSIGTPLYMAPEQWIEGEVDGRADLYALGLTLFHMLAGAPPFTGVGLAHLMVQHQRTPLPSLRASRPDVPAALEELIERMAAKSPDDRPASAASVAEGLRRALDAPPSSPAGRARSVPGGAAAAAGLAALVVVSAAVVVGRRDDEAAPGAIGPSSGAVASSTASAQPPTLEGWRPLWRRADGPRPELPHPALWIDELGEVADPLRGIRDGDSSALEAAFLGSVERLGEGRFGVDLDLEVALGLGRETPLRWLILGDRASVGPMRIGRSEGEAYAELLAPNDAGTVRLRLGRSRWRRAAAEVRLSWTEADATLISLAAGPRERSLELVGRGGRVSIAGAGSTKVDLVPGRPVHLRFAPGDVAGRRVVVNGVSLPTPEALVDAPHEGAVTLGLGEARYRLLACRLEGVPRRPDVVARAVIPGTLPSAARVTATWMIETPASGGPFVALGAPDGDELRLEVDDARVVLVRGERIVALASLAGPAAGPGSLTLERTGPRVVGEASVGGRVVRLQVVDPFPLPEVRASYGSGAGRVAFREVEVDGGESASPWALDGREDLVRQIGAVRRAAGRDPSPELAWRLGALLLREASEPEHAPVGHFGRVGDGRRRAAGAALEQLRVAARGAQDPAIREDALARGVVAAVLAADASAADGLARELLVAAGGIEAARVRIDATGDLDATLRLRWSERLLEGFGANIYDLGVALASVEVSAVLAPDRAARNDFRRGFVIVESCKRAGRAPTADEARRLQEVAIPALLRASENAGADGRRTASGAHAELGHAYRLLGDLERAVEHYDASATLEPWAWFGLRLLGETLLALGRDDEALVAYLAALSWVPERANMVQPVVLLARRVAVARPGLAAAALRGALEGHGASSEIHAEAVALAERALAGAASDLDRDLAVWVLQREGRAPPPDVLESERPSTALVRARAVVERDVDRAAEIFVGARGDRLLGALARLDPGLRPLRR